MELGLNTGLADQLLSPSSQSLCCAPEMILLWARLLDHKSHAITIPVDFPARVKQIPSGVKTLAQVNALSKQTWREQLSPRTLLVLGSRWSSLSRWNSWSRFLWSGMEEAWVFLHSQHLLWLRTQNGDSGISGQISPIQNYYSHLSPNKAPHVISCAGVSQGTLLPEGWLLKATAWAIWKHRAPGWAAWTCLGSGTATATSVTQKAEDCHIFKAQTE